MRRLFAILMDQGWMQYNKRNLKNPVRGPTQRIMTSTYTKILKVNSNI